MYIFSTDLKMIYRSKQQKNIGKTAYEVEKSNVHNFKEKILSHA